MSAGIVAPLCRDRAQRGIGCALHILIVTRFAVDIPLPTTHVCQVTVVDAGKTYSEEAVDESR